ncbi:MAG TPA: molybdopterin converting factor subunit 1 [Usitatibacter sp.]|nr:molybdopterin converting factor subunit 1 [Usitatibacter sp.]
MVTLLYFASLRERLGRSSEEVALAPGAATVGGLVEQLRLRGAGWTEALGPGSPWRVAVNQRMADRATPLRPGDEVAFFPPVTGG